MTQPHLPSDTSAFSTAEIKRRLAVMFGDSDDNEAEIVELNDRS
ncbi:hypothetical protein ACFWPK_32080 [Nocardia sp. NPDC058519]